MRCWCWNGESGYVVMCVRICRLGELVWVAAEVLVLDWKGRMLRVNLEYPQPDDRMTSISTIPRISSAG